MAEDQSGGTRTSGACSGAGEPGLGMGLGSGDGAWVGGDAWGGGESGFCCFIDRRRFRIAAVLERFFGGRRRVVGGGGGERRRKAGSGSGEKLGYKMHAPIAQ